jgi:dCMP deaminase
MEKVVSNNWDKRFMAVAEVVGGWSSCFQDNRHVGCVIVKNKRIIATGYNGAPSRVENCVERGYCMRQEEKIPSGTQAEKCYATHAEQNALVQAARMGISVEGATLYCTHQPCAICSKLIINAGITRIVYRESYPDKFAVSLLKESCVELVKI